MADDYPLQHRRLFMTISGGGIVGAVAAGESMNVTDRRAIRQRAPEMPPPPHCEVVGKAERAVTQSTLRNQIQIGGWPAI